MVNQTPLPALRHYVENLLAAFAFSLSTDDPEGFAGLVRGVELSVGSSWMRNPITADEVSEMFGRAPSAQWMSTCNLSVGFTDGAATYTAMYQRWDSRAPHACTEIGAFEGKLLPGPQVWCWREHHIMRG